MIEDKRQKNLRVSFLREFHRHIVPGMKAAYHWYKAIHLARINFHLDSHIPQYFLHYVHNQNSDLYGNFLESDNFPLQSL